jgi:hypothetical protein
MKGDGSPMMKLLMNVMPTTKLMKKLSMNLLAQVCSARVGVKVGLNHSVAIDDSGTPPARV